MDQVAPLPFEIPSTTDVKFASPVTVKRRKMSYGKAGVMMLTDDRLTFVTGHPQTSWQIGRTDVADLKRPWYGMGSYLTFDVKGAYYALAFGNEGWTLPRSRRQAVWP